MNVDLYISEALKQIIAVGPEGVPPQTPSSFRLLDHIEHPKTDDRLGWSGNHAFIKHVQDSLYHQGILNPALYQVLYRGTGAPNIPEPNPEPEPGVFSFRNAEFTQSFESAEMTAPAGLTNAILGFAMTAVVKEGTYFVGADHISKYLEVSFGGVPLSVVYVMHNVAGGFVVFCRNLITLPTTGKVKIGFKNGPATPVHNDRFQCLVGPVVGQVSFVSAKFNMRPMSASNRVNNRNLVVPVLGASSIQFWAAMHRPHWACGPHIPGRATEAYGDFTIEQSALVKGGQIWKPAAIEWMPDYGRPGGQLTYDKATGVFTLTRARDAGHPTVGVLIKVEDLGDVGQQYFEFQARPEDFSVQLQGTNNLSVQVARYLDGSDTEVNRMGNERDFARVRRIYTEADPLYMSAIKPSDTVANPGRDALVIFVRGLHVGNSVKFKIIRDGVAMRASIGRTKIPFGTNRNVNVGLANWRVMEDDDNIKAVLMAAGTTLPEPAGD